MIEYDVINKMTSCRVGKDVDEVKFIMNTYWNNIQKVLSSGDASVINIPNFGKFKIAYSQLHKEFAKKKRVAEQSIVVYNDHPSEYNKNKMETCIAAYEEILKRFVEKYDVEYIQNEKKKD